MIEIKKYIAEQFKGNTYHFKCDCVLALDLKGTVVDYELSGEEIILIVSVDHKILKVGINHPNLKIKKLND